MVETAHDRCVVVMMRYPEEGRVKTRLAAGVGKELALELYIRFIMDTLDNLLSVESDVVLAVRFGQESHSLTNEISRNHTILDQRGSNLGSRQFNAIKDAIELGYSRVAVIISDGPDIDPELIGSSFDLLEEYDSVIGPSGDGGYYLFGIRGDKFNEDILAGIDWNSNEIHARLKKNLERSGCSVIFLPEWPDIDDLGDLVDLAKRASVNGRAEHTMSLIRERMREVLPDEE